MLLKFGDCVASKESVIPFVSTVNTHPIVMVYGRVDWQHQIRTDYLGVSVVNRTCASHCVVMMYRSRVFTSLKVKFEGRTNDDSQISEGAQKTLFLFNSH
jgi:hypothetical protein